jgi:transcriptional regulator with XRE-family HTH domain
VENPTIQRRRLGLVLKRAREAAGKTQEEAAAAIDAAASKISRLELGQSGLKLTDLGALLEFYGIKGDEAEYMRGLAKSGRQRGRWSSYRNVIPDWFRQYVELEADASEIRWYQAEIVPGILQVESYSRAILTARPRPADDEAEKQIQVRLQRQTILDRPDSPELAFVLSESAIRRVAGEATTMRDQLLHLAQLTERPNVTLQVLPFDASTYDISQFGFTILRLGEGLGSEVIYLEDYTSADYLDALETVRTYTRLWNRLQAAALGPVESRRLINRVADEFRGSA